MCFTFSTLRLLTALVVLPVELALALALDSLLP
jgi:hypothetical protein